MKPLKDAFYGLYFTPFVFYRRPATYFTFKTRHFVESTDTGAIFVRIVSVCGSNHSARDGTDVAQSRTTPTSLNSFLCLLLKPFEDLKSLYPKFCISLLVLKWLGVFSEFISVPSPFTVLCFKGAIELLFLFKLFYLSFSVTFVRNLHISRFLTY